MAGPREVSATAPAPETRLRFLDVVRGLAIVAMVINHTARYWIEGRMTWPRYHLIYLSLTLAAPMFLFLVGFGLALARRRSGRGFPTTLRRATMIIVGGYALNVVVFPNEPAWVGGVLQMIGLSIIGLAPLVRFASSSRVRAALLGVAIAMYVAFSLSHPAVEAWIAHHPLIGQIFFFDFPLWPWISLPLVGLVLGSVFVQRRQESARAVSRYMLAMTGAGVVCLFAFFALDWWFGTPLRFGLRRDFILNHHWVPRGFALLWVFGTIFLELAATYWLVERLQVPAGWFVSLGRTAFMLYFAHQVVVVTIVKRLLGVSFPSWWSFSLANALLLVGLVYLGEGWLALKRRLT
jgi:uncharacterized membrane protein